MKIAHITAVSSNDVIGVKNDLPWNIPEDMAFFKEKTKGRILIMGRKTFESVGHPLPHRLNIVISRQPGFTHESKNVVVVKSLEDAINYSRGKTALYGDEVFIIGGGEIYKASMDIVDIIYLTRIHRDFDGDTFYPKLDPKIFELVESRERTEPVPFTFQTFIRRTVTLLN
jgi:dihydrofolate reductase